VSKEELNKFVEILKRLQPIFRNILRAPELDLALELSPTQIPSWDSLNHLSLIISIESEFNIRFSTEEIIQIKSVKDFCQIIANNLKS